MPDNRGYGAGCVIGLQSATRPVTGLINPDVEFVDSSIDRLVQLLADGNPDRLLSPVLIHPDGRRQDAVHPLPGSGAEALRALIPAPSMPNRLAAWMEPHRSELPTRVGWAVGASLIGRTHTLLELGPFDPDVHLYAEDLDLCLRAAERGIETWYHPEARVIHREAHSTRAAFNGEPSDLLALRRRKVVAQRLGKAVARRDDLIQTVTNLDRLALKRISRRDTSLEQSRLRAIRAARRNGS
jgi:N-acetylglucosaminyl-diphospho-decaprenol L-rhamnosyltransferase